MKYNLFPVSDLANIIALTAYTTPVHITPPSAGTALVTFLLQF